MTSILKLSPRDPLIARDSRPLTAGGRMRSLDWPMPSVIAGSARTMLAKQLGWDLKDAATQKKLLEDVSVSCCLPIVDGRLLVPAPADCVIAEHCRGNGNHIASARPSSLKDGEGVDLPVESLDPVILNNTDEFKAKAGWGFWTLESLIHWLGDPKGTATRPDQLSPRYRPPVHDQRFHVNITSSSGTAKDGMLFSTDGLDLTTLPAEDGSLSPFDGKSELTLEVLIDGSGSPSLAGAITSLSGRWQSVGGERRLCWWERSTAVIESSRWSFPGNCTLFSGKPQKIRMVLVSPAIFPVNGWFPDWLDSQSLTGKIPGTSITVKLTGACVNRWQGVSGWSYASNQPKAISRTVPAGSVYFMEMIDPTDLPTGISSELQSCWLQTVCSDSEGQLTQHGRDGFGTAVWGVWDSH